MPQGSRFPIPLLIQPLASRQLQIHSSKHDVQNDRDQDEKSIGTKPNPDTGKQNQASGDTEPKPVDFSLPKDTTVDMVRHKSHNKSQNNGQKCTNDGNDVLHKKTMNEGKTKTNKISEKKKPFPVKFIKQVNNVLDKDTVEIILNNINNKIPHKGCRTHQYLQRNQRVTFKSPVTEKHQKSHSANEKHPTPNTIIVENGVKNKQVGNTDEMMPMTKDNKVTIMMQVKQLVGAR